MLVTDHCFYVQQVYPPCHTLRPRDVEMSNFIEQQEDGFCINI